MAVLFAVHPINVESVAWVAERKNLLCTIFFLFALGAYGWYARRPSEKRYLFVALLFAMGLAAKPMLVTVPCVLLLLDFWPLNRVQGWDGFSRQGIEESRRNRKQSEGEIVKVTFSRAVLEKLPLLALSAGDAVITVFAQHTGGAMRLALPLSVRLENAIYVYAMYVWKAFWPVGMAPFYPHPASSLPIIGVVGALFVLVLITSVAIALRRTAPWLFIGWAWYLIMLMPVIGIVQIGMQAHADRYTYLPQIGLLLAIGYGLRRLTQGFRARLQMMTCVALVAFLVMQRTLSHHA